MLYKKVDREELSGDDYIKFVGVHFLTWERWKHKYNIPEWETACVEICDQIELKKRIIEAVDKWERTYISSIGFPYSLGVEDDFTWKKYYEAMMPCADMILDAIESALLVRKE